MIDNKQLQKMINDLKYDYDDEKITFFIELNDAHGEQVFQTMPFDTPQGALDWWNDWCLFCDASEHELWLMYEVENSDIDRFCDVVMKNGKYVLEV